MEHRIAYLRPKQVNLLLKKTPVVFVPLSPLEWHGPHLPLGTDPLNAEQVAMATCSKTGGLVWPTLFWGTERERSEQELRNLGFDPGTYVVGMDFPNNTLPSAYCSEAIFALLVRETLRLVEDIGARIVVIVNGHGAVNHNAVLNRLAVEINNTRNVHVHVRVAIPMEDIRASSMAHAGRDETSLIMHYCPETVDIGTLPPSEQPIHFSDFAIVDGPGFEGKGRPDKIVEDDPRSEVSANKGKRIHEITVNELARDVRSLLETLERP